MKKRRRCAKVQLKVVITEARTSGLGYSVPTWSTLDKEESLACEITSSFNNKVGWAVVGAQLVAQLLLIPEVCGSTPVIGKHLY